MLLMPPTMRTASIHVLLLAQSAVTALRPAGWDSGITTGTRAGSHVESSSCLATGPDCCRCASVSVFVILGSRPGLAMGLASSPVHVLVLAQIAVLAAQFLSCCRLRLAVAALWTACCDSWIMTGTRAGSHVESSSCLATGPDCCRCALDSML
jgi:hypothetical protein